MFKNLVTVGILSLSVFAGIQETTQQKELSELSVAKAIIIKLQTDLAQCRADKQEKENTLASITLTTQQGKLEELFRKELGCKPTDKFDWATLTCKNETIIK